VDESGFAHDMPRIHGYAPRGQRCFGVRDWQAKGRTNVIGALLNQKLLTTCLVNTSVDSAVFYAWLTQDLLPKVPPNAVIVMDNATFHKRQNSHAEILKAGCALEYLPPYSPDLNPIEHKWAQAKSIRRAQACSLDDLFSRASL
jgi:transposase